MTRPKLLHPSRAVLVHIPTTDLEHLDAEARAAKTSRSEIIRRRLRTSMASPAESSDPRFFRVPD